MTESNSAKVARDTYHGSVPNMKNNSEIIYVKSHFLFLEFAEGCEESLQSCW